MRAVGCVVLLRKEWFSYKWRQYCAKAISHVDELHRPRSVWSPQLYNHHVASWKNKNMQCYSPMRRYPICLFRSICIFTVPQCSIRISHVYCLLNYIGVTLYRTKCILRARPRPTQLLHNLPWSQLTTTDLSQPYWDSASKTHNIQLHTFMDDKTESSWKKCLLALRHPRAMPWSPMAMANSQSVCNHGTTATPRAMRRRYTKRRPSLCLTKRSVRMPATKDPITMPANLAERALDSSS